MKTTYYSSETRGFADHGWLKATHSFSFADYYDPKRMRFGLLRVLNDDIIAAGKGFGTHPHDNMEIVTIPLSGALEHKDNMGNGEVIHSGEVQRMSAGSGITHSEFNPSPSEISNVLQIWVYPKEKNIKPSYEQKRFEASERKNRLQVLVSPDRRDGSLWINQNAIFSRIDLDSKQTISYSPIFKGNGLYIFVISGEVKVTDQKLKEKDALGVEQFSEVSMAAEKKSEILFIEVPMT